MKWNREELQIEQTLGSVRMPPLVEDRLRETYATLSTDSAKPQSRKRSLRWKMTGLIAACFALLVVAGTINPAFAEKIPFVGNVFELLHDWAVTLPKESGFASGNQADYASALDQKARVGIFSNPKLTLIAKEAYSDGSMLYVTWLLDSRDPALNEFDSFTDNFHTTILVNGQELWDAGIRLTKAEDGRYVGLGAYELSDFPDEKESAPAVLEVEARFGKLTADRFMEGAEALESKSVYVDWSISFTVPVDRTHVRTMAGGPQEQNGIRLLGVEATPGALIVRYDVSDQYNNPAAVFIAENRKTLPWILGHFREGNGVEERCEKVEPLSENCDTFYMRVIDKNNGDGIIAEFEVKVK